VVAVLGAPELGHHPVPGVQQPQPFRRAGYCGELLTDARRLEDAMDFVVGCDGAGERVDVLVAFEDDTADSAPGQEKGGGHAHRPGPDDHDGHTCGFIDGHVRLTSGVISRP
jgi:hypothetical protein